MNDWRPVASMEGLRARAAMLRGIRGFFEARGVLEVETPILSRYGNTDPAVESLRTRYQGPGAAQGLTMLLQTSPEFAMKRLLAAGSGPIYQVCKVFRNGEAGVRHNPEFSLLEWYRPGFDIHRLMDELEALVNSLLPTAAAWQRLTYAEAFQRFLGIDPHGADARQLRQLAIERGVISRGGLELEERDAWLDLLLTHCVEPQLVAMGAVFIYDYPASQAALARLRPGSPPVAERFELYLDGVELANGFHELADAAEQRRRFEADNGKRRSAALAPSPVDEWLLGALANGPLPDCSGVALGLDRLLMKITGADRIDQVLSFPLHNA